MGPDSEDDRDPLPSEVAVDLTTELRWFFDGPLPPEVLNWFLRAGTGRVEDRCDTYRLDREVDIGVKRRFRRTLELKLRIGTPEPFGVSGQFDGWLEAWKRWSPADGRVNLDETTVWVDVDKTVIKRRFDPSGQEVPLSGSAPTVAADTCEVEVAAISVNAMQAWSLALAVYGSPEHHRSILVRSWEALCVDRPDALHLDLNQHRSCGYPEWLARVASLPAKARRDRLDSPPTPRG